MLKIQHIHHKNFVVSIQLVGALWIPYLFYLIAIWGRYCFAYFCVKAVIWFEFLRTFSQSTVHLLDV